MAISMLKIRRPLGRLIFNMGIAIPGKTVFLIETAPWPSHKHSCRLGRVDSNFHFRITCTQIAMTLTIPLFRFMLWCKSWRNLYYVAYQISMCSFSYDIWHEICFYDRYADYLLTPILSRVHLTRSKVTNFGFLSSRAYQYWNKTCRF